MMNLDKLNIWLTLGANVGVIAGIIFLAIEINQNNVLLEEQARFSFLQNRNASSRRLMEEPCYSAFMGKLANGETLTPDEEWMKQGYYTEMLNNWQWEYNQYQNGRVQESDLPVKTWGMVMHDEDNYPTPGFADFVEERFHKYNSISPELYQLLRSL